MCVRVCVGGFKFTLAACFPTDASSGGGGFVYTDQHVNLQRLEMLQILTEQLRGAAAALLQDNEAR